MISAGSAVSERSTAPSTDCSASRFCGGATGPSGTRSAALLPLVRSGLLTGQPSLGRGSDRTYVLTANSGEFCLRGLLLLDHHRLDGRCHARLDLDDDHPRADGLDRLLEVDVAAID